MPTTETTLAHPYRYGSITRRDGTHGTSYQVRFRSAEPGVALKTLTTHTLEEAADTLKQWNEEREEQFLHASRQRR
jgi:hypothetical protein